MKSRFVKALVLALTAGAVMTGSIPVSAAEEKTEAVKDTEEGDRKSVV